MGGIEKWFARNGDDGPRDTKGGPVATKILCGARALVPIPVCVDAIYWSLFVGKTGDGAPPGGRPPADADQR